MNESLESLHDLQLMARYNAWANERLYAAVETLDDDDYRADHGAYFRSVHATLNHLLVGDRVWTSRIIGEYSGIKSLDEILFEDFQGLRQARKAMDDHIRLMVDRMSVGLDGGFNREVRYRSMLGGPKHASPAHHLFLTLFNHQTHHRGQIHCLLTQLGMKEPPALDVIFMLREASETPEKT